MAGVHKQRDAALATDPREPRRSAIGCRFVRADAARIIGDLTRAVLETIPRCTVRGIGGRTKGRSNEGNNEDWKAGHIRFASTTVLKRPDI